MAFIDITVPLRPGAVPVYPGDTELVVERTSSLRAGDDNNTSKVVCTAHCGTHVDAPVHFIDGAGGIDAVPLEALIGRAHVVDATAVDGHVDAAALDRLGLPDDAERVLLKTASGRLWDRPRFSEDFVAVTEDGARELVERGVRLVGIDYLSSAPSDDPAPTHVALLRAGVAIVEALDLRHVPAGAYELVCLPIRLADADGAPARAVLRPLG